jgi:hypothetical protein
MMLKFALHLYTSLESHTLLFTACGLYILFLFLNITHSLYNSLPWCASSSVAQPPPPHHSLQLQPSFLLRLARSFTHHRHPRRPHLLLQQHRFLRSSRRRLVFTQTATTTSME